MQMMNKDHKDVYDFMVSYKEQYGVYPSIKLIGQSINFAYSKVYFIFKRLTKHGFMVNNGYGNYDLIPRGTAKPAEVPTSTPQTEKTPCATGWFTDSLDVSVMLNTIYDSLKDSKRICRSLTQRAALSGSEKELNIAVLTGNFLEQTMQFLKDNGCKGTKG